MNDKIKNTISICIIVLFIILMIVYGVRKNKKVDTNQDVTDNSVAVEKQVEENKVEDNSNTTIQETSSDKKDESKKDNTSSEKKKSEADDKVNVKTTFDETAFSNGHLENYPEFGTEYATLIINKIKVNAPIIYGLTDEILLKGVAQDSGSYFPGENGSIIMCVHNYMNNFSKLGELKNGDIIEVKTRYGDFYYKKYDEQIVMDSEKSKLPIQEDKEILMIYTCYPLENSNNTEYRYVIYAEKI